VEQFADPADRTSDDAVQPNGLSEAPNSTNGARIYEATVEGCLALVFLENGARQLKQLFHLTT